MPAFGENITSLKESEVFSTILDMTASESYCLEENCMIAQDSEGNIYTCGNSFNTKNLNCPVYTFNTTKSFNITITKFDTTGNNAIYSVLVGGGCVKDFTVDSEGNCYIVGYTESNNFPVTSTALDTIYHFCKGFITKISNDGSHLVFSTFLGGSTFDLINTIILDTVDNIYIAGGTRSLDFPVTEGVFQTQKQSNYYDTGFITCLSSNGENIIFSTYLGGYLIDSITGIALDSVQNIYVTGYSNSTDFPLTANAFDTFHYIERNNQDSVFISKLSPGAVNLIYSSFIGGNDDDEPSALGIDPSGNMYITGYTRSIDFPVSSNDTAPIRGEESTFITCLSAQGDRLIYSYVIDSTFENVGKDIQIDKEGNAFVCGYTYGHILPITEGAFDFFSEATTGINNYKDGYFFAVNSTGKVKYGTYLGDYWTSAKSILLKESGECWILGTTNTPYFPMSLECKTIKNDHSAINQFLVKLKPETYLGPAFPNKLKATATTSSTIQLSWIDTANNEDGFKIFAIKENGSWTKVGQTGPNTNHFVDMGLPELTARTYKIYAYNSSYQSFWSNSAFAKTLKATIFANNFSLQTGYHKVRVDWDNPDVPEYFATRILRKEGSPSTSTTDGVLVYEGDGTYCTDSNLANGMVYYYTAYIQDTSHYYAEGTSLNITLYPAPVNQFTAMPQGTSVMLTWNNPHDDDYQATLIVRRTDRYPLNPIDGDVIYWYNGNYCEDKNKVNGVTYYYAAYANDTQKVFSAPVKDQVTMGDTTPPQGVTATGFIPGDGKINITWENPSDADYVSTLICRRDDRFSLYPGDGTVVYWYNGTAWTDQPLENGKTYYYSLYVQDKNHNFSEPWQESVYLNSWQNRMSDFDVASDTGNWAYENAEGIDKMPAISWEPLFANHTGLMKITFSSQTEGIKITGFGRISANNSTNWVNLSLSYMEDSSNNNIEILPVGLYFSNPTSWALKGVGASWTGKNQAAKNEWHTWNTCMESRHFMAQPQLILKNNGHPGTLYIDSVELNHIPVPVISNDTSYSYEYGDFTPATDTAQWGFETLDEATGGMPEITVVNTNNRRMYDALKITFTGPDQGVKMTSKTLFDLQTSAPLFLYYQVPLSSNTVQGLDVGSFLYSEDSSDQSLYEIGGSYDIGFMGADMDERRMALNPLAGHTKGRIQFIFRNHEDYPFSLLLDNIVFSSSVDK
jgi:hypothetical protein